MICLQDSPGDKARFTLDVHVPLGLSTLGPGKHVGVEKLPGGTLIHRWQSTRSYSAYLYGFAVGKLIRATVRKGNDAVAYSGEAPPYTQLLVPGREAQKAATYALIGRGELECSAGRP